ncbi:MAG: hypothetical protein AB7F40_08620 [Victivallaceae bacterium]|nr:hypothetical protein [Victivallaceae bacterium]
MKKIAVTLLLCVFASAAFAGFWDWATPYQGPEKDVITLIITANYQMPRALAEVIQYENRQPILLLPYRGARGIFFMPGGRKQALEIQADQFAQFICFLNPKHIIILGDNRYVSDDYRKLLEFNGFSPITFSGDWFKASRDIAKLLRLQNLETNYKRVIDATTGNYIPGRGRNLEDNANIITVDRQ